MELAGENLFAVITARDGGGTPLTPASLEPLVHPFVTSHMAGWLLTSLVDQVARGFAERTLPSFWSACGPRDAPLDPDGLRKAAETALFDLDLFTDKLQALATALGRSEWSAAEALVPCLFREDDAELLAVLQKFADALFAARLSGDEVAGASRVMVFFARTNLMGRLVDCGVATVEKSLASRLTESAKVWDTPCLAGVLQWLESEAFEWIDSLRQHLGNGQDGKSLRQRLWRDALTQFCRLRAGELFDIIVGYPEETLVAVNDLKDCVSHLTALGGNCEELQTTLSASLRARLLHPGANTADIIRTYMLCIHVLRVVDPSGVMLDRVSGPTRKYLTNRADTIKCIVQSLTDPAGDLFSELCKTSSDTEALKAKVPGVWTPEPADSLPQSEGVSRHKDVVELLVNIFGGNEPFVAEFKSLIGQRLLEAKEYDVDAEIRTLELLKLRFGDATLNDCEIMVRDMADSKRVNKLVVDKDAGLENVNAVMVSHLYWPSTALAAPVEFEPAPKMKAVLDGYEKAFKEVKASRKLQWKLGLGEVEMTVCLPNRQPIKCVGVTLFQATLLELFQECSEWSVDDLAKRCKIEGGAQSEMLRKALLHWARHGILRNDGSKMWKVYLPKEDEIVEFVGEDMMEESDEDGDGNDDMAEAEPFVLHMLNNLGQLPLVQIQDQLKNFADIDKPSAVIKQFLQQMVLDEKIVLKEGLYSAKK